jgi:epoxyqueuosine reductase
MTERIKAFAAELGFDRCGIAAAGNVDPDDRFDAWLDAGFNADMEWMARNRDVRKDIRLLLPGARSVVVVARNYYAPRPDVSDTAGVYHGRVSRYAWGLDYHRIMREPMKRLAARIQELGGAGNGAVCAISVDSGRVLEKFWAAHAGVGWIGRNSVVNVPGIGSFVFLGVVATTIELAPDVPMESKCGSCRLCIDSCPTRAITECQGVDARRCLSYLTVEKRGDIPSEYHRALGNRVFGCDTCQEACPYNSAPPVTDEPGFLPRMDQANPELRELSVIDDAEFLQRFSGTAILRAKPDGIRRNARIARKNCL